MKPELWKPVVGYEGFYDVSDKGRVRSLSRYVKHSVGVGNTRWVTGRILSQKLDSQKRYKMVSLCKLGVNATKLVHILVAGSFIGDRPDRSLIHHINGDKLNNTPENLEYVDIFRHLSSHNKGNTRGRGEKCGMAKLKNKDVVEIKEMLKQGDLLQKEIAAKYGVGANVVSRINTGSRWGHIS